MNSTEQAFQELFTNQMVAFADFMASSIGEMHPELALDDLDRIREMGKERCDGINLVEATATLPKKRGKKASTPKSKASRSTLSPESRCMARAWQDGTGFGQCGKSRTNDTDYCNAHSKKASICETPLKVDPSALESAHVPSSLRIGLFMGRVDQFQDGQDGIPPYKDEHGIIRIEWTGEDMRNLLANDVEAGTARYAGGGEKKGKTKAKAKAKGKKVDAELVSVLEDGSEEFGSTVLMDALASCSSLKEEGGEDELPVVDAGGAVEHAEEHVVDVGDEGAIETAPELVDGDAEEHVTDVGDEVDGAEEEEPAELGDLLNDAYDAETEDEGMEVEELEHEGVTYHVEPESRDIYNVDDGSVIGTWELGANGMEDGHPIMKDE